MEYFWGKNSTDFDLYTDRFYLSAQLITVQIKSGKVHKSLNKEFILSTCDKWNFVLLLLEY